MPLIQLPRNLAEILRTLISAGAATPMQLEVKSGLIGQDIEAELLALREMGLVESAATSGGTERELFYPSAKGRDLVR